MYDHWTSFVLRRTDRLTASSTCVTFVRTMRTLISIDQVFLYNFFFQSIWVIVIENDLFYTSFITFQLSLSSSFTLTNEESVGIETNCLILKFVLIILWFLLLTLNIVSDEASFVVLKKTRMQIWKYLFFYSTWAIISCYHWFAISKINKIVFENESGKKNLISLHPIFRPIRLSNPRVTVLRRRSKKILTFPTEDAISYSVVV